MGRVSAGSDGRVSGAGLPDPAGPQDGPDHRRGGPAGTDSDKKPPRGTDEPGCGGEETDDASQSCATRHDREGRIQRTSASGDLGTRRDRSDCLDESAVATFESQVNEAVIAESVGCFAPAV